jgi:hypothetical protein
VAMPITSEVKLMTAVMRLNAMTLRQPSAM